jgi:hypothetical protein
MNMITEKGMIKELKAMRKDSPCTMEYLVDMDTRLTLEEEDIPEEGIKEFIKRKVINCEDLESDRDEF